MRALLHFLICTALRGHIVVAEALYKITYYCHHYYSQLRFFDNGELARACASWSYGGKPQQRYTACGTTCGCGLSLMSAPAIKTQQFQTLVMKRHEHCQVHNQLGLDAHR